MNNTELPLRQRLTSRKFWLTVTVAVIVVVGEHLGIDLDAEQLLALATAVGLYSVGNGLQKR